MDTATYQHTLAATAMTDKARRAAIERIEVLMAPGAHAITASRTPASEFWLDEERKYPTLDVTLIWRDRGTNNRMARAPFDGEGTTWHVQIVGCDYASSHLLAEVARLAAIATGEIVAKYTAITRAQVATQEAEAARLALVAVEIGVRHADDPA